MAPGGSARTWPRFRQATGRRQMHGTLRMVSRAAQRDSASPTSPRSCQSGDKSPHSAIAAAHEDSERQRRQQRNKGLWRKAALAERLHAMGDKPSSSRQPFIPFGFVYFGLFCDHSTAVVIMEVCRVVWYAAPNCACLVLNAAKVLPQRRARQVRRTHWTPAGTSKVAPVSNPARRSGSRSPYVA